MRCIVCGATERDTQKVSFHSFPINEKQRCLWQKRLNLCAQDVLPNSVVCHRHFNPVDVIEKRQNKKRRYYLAPEAVPVDNTQHDELRMQKNIGPVEAAKTETNKVGSVASSSSSDPSSFEQHKEITLLKKRNKILSSKITNLRAQNKVSNQTIRRKDKKIKELEERVAKQEKELAESVSEDILNRTMTPPMRALFERIIGRESSQQYTETLKRFSIELDFLSPRAYRFVRAQSRNNLPNPRTIGTWFESIDCDPGFTHEAFSLVKSFCQAENSQGREVTCQLAFDEIHIFSQVQRIGSKAYGEPSFGDATIPESTTAAARKRKKTQKKSKGATQILLFMLVSVDMRWKIPVGYFPIDSLYADQKAELILQTIYRAEDAGVVVLGLTFDGAPVNLSTMRQLGVDIERESEVYSFYPPDLNDSNTSEENEIFVYPDPCHMLKLIRNVFGEHSLIDGEGRQINFKFIGELFKLQRSVGINFSNKLKTAHMEFGGKKMNVRLATQLLSRSVADDIDMCRDELQLPEFSGSEGTTKFIRIMNDSFDVQNSRNASHTGCKSPITEENITFLENFCQETISYINSLQLVRGETTQLVVNSTLNTGFIGMRTSLTNLPKMYNKVKNSVTEGLKTYSLNQDHVEIFFGTIRTRLGCNTNPTVLQFRAAYKRLVTYVQLEESVDGTNCLGNLEKVLVLGVNTKRSIDYLNEAKQDNLSGDQFKTEDEVEYEIIQNENQNNETEDDNSMVVTQASQKALQILSYKVISKMSQKISCECCGIHLVEDHSKKRPSRLIIDVTTHCEAYIQQGIKSHGEKTFALSMKIENLVNDTLYRFKDYAFEHNILHLTENVDHFTNLLSIFVTFFANARIHHEFEKMNDSLSVRNKLHRLVHFKNM